MSLININVSQELVSLSNQEADWWKRASKARREAYIKKHPKSKYANAVRSGKLKVDSPTVKPKSKKPAKGKSAKTPKSPRKSSTRKSTRKTEPKHKATPPPKRPEKEKPVSKSRELRATEAVIDREEKRRATDLTPIIQEEVKDNFRAIREKKDKIVKAVKSKLSPRGGNQIRGFAKKFLGGGFKMKSASDEEKAGARKATKILDSITENLLGRQRYASTGKTVGHVLLSIFMGPTNYKELKDVVGADQPQMESNSSVRKDTEENQWLSDITQWFDSMVDVRLRSLSAEEEESEEDEEFEDEDPKVLDTLDTFIQRYLDWFKQIDINSLSEKVALLQSRYEMIEEGYKPSQEDIDSELEDDEEDEIDIPGELDMLESESGAIPRISFKVCPAQKRTAHADRTRYDVMFSGRQIGQVESDPKINGNGKSRRSWVIKLFEGFNESAYRSGRDSTQPYTVVNSNQVVLLNPIRQTFDECRTWIKHSLVKEML